MSLSLFPDTISEYPETEGIKYAGSKLRLLPYILHIVHQIKPKTIFDGFAGTTRVSQAFAQMGYQVTANDSATWSHNFGLCYLKNKHNGHYYQKIMDHLNALPGKDGWFTEHYGGLPEADPVNPQRLKKPWQIHNTRKLDAIREEIDRLNLDEIERAVVLTSLMLALDQVDSTLGHFASYLHEWSPRSYRTLQLAVPKLIESEQHHEVRNANIFSIIDEISTDLAYYDPPYGSNNEKMPPSRVRYAAYYHIWKTICLNDQPKLFGKANRRVDSSDTTACSVFEEFRVSETGRFIAVEAIEQLLRRTKSQYIILSYSSGGRATAAELYEILSNAGRLLEVQKIDYRRNVMARMRWTHKWLHDHEPEHYEYLFLIEKTD